LLLDWRNNTKLVHSLRLVSEQKLLQIAINILLFAIEEVSRCAWLWIACRRD